ncbi:carboxylesterase/lipase family protein [Nocardia stercoris]|uniref:carboxylesterase/lipase family protein n=1 Tax=Nocardia stercoris TaxID=2483361 RepID=UPI001F229CE7|nr:carboxylesterase family protein [Nocardia stercoris]
MDSIVSVTGGQVRGFEADGVHAFLGIPHAAPAVGPARFELPRPVVPWTGVRDGSAHGPNCLQSPYPAPVEALLPGVRLLGDEYLNVNVWTPDPAGSGLPVLVWIHGGAFTRGSNAGPVYDGRAFARDGVVLVSVNYRLGISGFTAVPGAPLNRGLHDQVAALRWVRENVAAFGGDPDNVTVFGESAGGMSVLSLLAAPAARGLFRRAAVQSANGSAAATAEDGYRLAARLAQQLGIECTAAAFGAVPLERLQAAQDAIATAMALDPNPAVWGESVLEAGGGILSFFPVIDGDLLSGRPIDVLTTPGHRTVPLLAGWNRDDFRLFVFPVGRDAAITADTLPPLLAFCGLTPDLAETYAASRPAAGPADVFAAIMTDRTFTDDVLRLADHSAAQGIPQYRYEFRWPTPVARLDAGHAVELPFVFDRLDSLPSLTGIDPPQPLAGQMHRAWVRFAVDGDPGWSRYDEPDRKVRIFDHPAAGEVSDPRGAELRALRSSLARRRASAHQ